MFDARLAPIVGLLATAGFLALLVLASQAHDAWWQDLQRDSPRLARILDRASAIVGATLAGAVLIGSGALCLWLGAWGMHTLVTEGIPYLLAGRVTAYDVGSFLAGSAWFVPLVVGLVFVIWSTVTEGRREEGR